ncbi:MAG: Fic family protein, partial [Bacteroidales bacterium]|nr:Fic family protein [Bacteroidales bacterium]
SKDTDMIKDINKPNNDLKKLPPEVNLETPEIFRACIKANKALAELKGCCMRLPNPEMLLNTVILQESKTSSEIENIVTTQDDLYKATLDEIDKISNPAAKEVILYREAIYKGIELFKNRGIITANMLIEIMQTLRGTQEGIRKICGTKISNPATKKVVYTPPEGETLIREKLSDLEKFINDDDTELDTLVKMALIHYQFEAIHPFSDGNGRTGRILNILYLIKEGLLDMPILYLSHYIIVYKSVYYKLLNNVTLNDEWADWVLYMIKAVEETAKYTLNQIEEILRLKNETEQKVKEVLQSNIYKELTELLFMHPYIKIKVLEDKGIAKRQTVSIYLKKLSEAGILNPVKLWKETYYINTALFDLLSKGIEMKN